MIFYLSAPPSSSPADVHANTETAVVVLGTRNFTGVVRRNTSKSTTVDPNSVQGSSDSDTHWDERVSAPYVFVLFYTKWCGFCKSVRPMLPVIADELHQLTENITVAQMDVDVDHPPPEIDVSRDWFFFKLFD